jgi:hypothetical protein
MPDRKITQFPDFEGTADSSLFFVVASGDSNNPLSKNYRFPFTQLASDVIGANSPWKLGSDSIYTLTGLVGMGTASPAYQLDVAGTISGYSGKFKEGIFSEGLTISGVSVATGMGGKWEEVSPGSIRYEGAVFTEDVFDCANLYLQNQDGLAGAALRSSGHSFMLDNVAVGHNNPSARLHVTGGKILAPSGDFTKSLTISGVSVTTGEHDGKWSDGASAGDIYYDGGDAGLGTNDPYARLHVTGGDGRILAPSGDFTKSLTISGQPVSTGMGGKWEDSPFFPYGEDIYYTGGQVGIGTDDPVAALNVKGPLGQSSNRLLWLGTDVGGIDNARAVVKGSSSTSALLTLYDTNTLPLVELNTAGDSYFAGGPVVVGATSAPRGQLFVTGGEGTIVAPSGDFTKSLTISGVPVSTGAGGAGKWIDDPAYALGITYEDGPVAISGDLRVSGSGYFSSNTLLVGEDISLKAANDYLIISGSGIKVGDPGSEDIVLTTEKLGLGTTANLSEEPGDINFKLLTDQNRFVVGTTGQPGGDLSGWYRFNDYTVKGASDMGAHVMNPVDTRIYTEGSTFMLLSEDSDGGPIGYIANGAGAISANNAIAIGIAPKLDETETPRDLEFTDTDGEVYSVINGDSDSVGVNSLPLSQGLQAPSMGAVPATLLIDGGYF